MREWQEATGSSTVFLERYGMTEIGMALSNPLEVEPREHARHTSSTILNPCMTRSALFTGRNGVTPLRNLVLLEYSPWSRGHFWGI